MPRMLRFHYHRYLLTFLLPLLLVSPLTSASQDKPYYKVPHATDLQADGELASKENLPLLIMFSQSGCTYCDLVREDFLEPMRKSGDYTDKVIMRIIKLDDYGNVRDFDGQMRKPIDIAVRYRASLTPTVIFVDHRGKELTERILGISTPPLYGGLLDDAIDLSLQRIRPINVSRQVEDKTSRLE
ncbi:MAG: thioredoxin fold domain-containing protein [Thiohalophilus sp.]|jgi:thioredoxin-related protein